jgi:hypothetical protein
MPLSEAAISTSLESGNEMREPESIAERAIPLDELGRCFTNLYL